MKYLVTEEYVDCMCPSGEYDEVIRTDVVEAASEREACELYKLRHHVDWNNTVRARIHRAE